MRTFSRAHWNAAQLAWRDFSDEWKPFRHEAAMRGMLYPPEGTRWDSWEDDEPSQRAMLIRAIRETPSLLHFAISVSDSWASVIRHILRARDEWREDLRRELVIRDEPSNYEATVSIRRVLERIGNS